MEDRNKIKNKTY